MNAANLSAINSALNSAAVNGTATATATQIQTLVNAFNNLLAAADGNYSNNGAASLSQGDYIALGVTGTTAASAALMSVVIDGKVSADVNTVQKLQTLADAAKAVLGYDDPVADAGAAPSAAQINSLIAGQSVGGIPVPTVTEDALAAVRAAISAANSDGTPLATQAEIAAVVKAAV